MRTVRLPTVFFLLLTLPASPAFAKEPAAETRDDEMARTLFNTGRAYFERAKYDEAAEAFGEAYALSGRPQLLVNQARALEAAGRVEESIAVLETFLEVEQNDAAAREGVHGMLRRLRADSERRARERAEAEAAQAAQAEEGEKPVVDLAEAPEERRSVAKITGLGAIGLGAASGVVALATGLRSRNLHDSLERACPMDVCVPEMRGDVDRGHRLAVTSTVFTFVGVAAVASGVLVLVLTKDASDDPQSAKVELTPGPGAGAGLRVTF